MKFLFILLNWVFREYFANTVASFNQNWDNDNKLN